MATNVINSPIETIQIQIPKCDMAFLRKLANKMGWSIPSKKSVSALERSLADIENGRVTTYESVNDFYKEMGI